MYIYIEFLSRPTNLYDDIDENNFIVTVKDNRTILNKNALNSDEEEKQTKKTYANEMDKFTFMQQFEKDADERAKARRERERIAQHFRT